jgi:hypothetical protein
LKSREIFTIFSWPQAELTPSKPDQVATAVYYASDKLFPSSAVPSTGDETFEKMAMAISGRGENKSGDGRENDLDNVKVSFNFLPT